MPGISVGRGRMTATQRPSRESSSTIGKTGHVCFDAKNLILDEPPNSRWRPSGRNEIRCSRSVTDSHATLRRSQTRFDSWRGYCPLPASVSGARRSSKPQGRVRLPGGGTAIGITSLECDGFAHDSAKVGDQVRFLARTSPFSDAGARRPGDRLQPGSSGFDSHRRLIYQGGAVEAGARPRCPAGRGRSPACTSPSPRSNQSRRLAGAAELRQVGGSFSLPGLDPIDQVIDLVELPRPCK